MGKRTHGSGLRKTAGRVALDPELISLMNLVNASRFADVEITSRRILVKRPNQPLAMKALTFALLGLGRFEEALPILDFCVSIFPQDAELQNNRGIALASMMRWEDSLVSFRRARTLTPNDPELLKNIGGTLLRMHEWDEAVPVLLEAIEKHPDDYVEAIILLASALLNGNRIEEAWICINEIHAADNNNLTALYLLIWVGLKQCHWEGMLHHLEVLREQSAGFQATLYNPFPALAFPGVDGRDLRCIAEGFASDVLPLESGTEELAGRTGERQRLRIGYLSGDFRLHAVGLVVAEVFERHDREKVEIYGYSTTRSDESQIRKRLVACFDQFVDLVGLPVQAVAERIRADNVDVLVDVSGWTSSGRPEALALRCAPVQVNWLGYGGTMGHVGVADYIVGDPVVTPSEHAALYSELIAQLPHCYLPADTSRQIAQTPSRQSTGLPDTGFVFCSFNNSYKYNPPLFDIWADMLKRAPDSVLWLSYPGDKAAEALRKEMAGRGVTADRLLFAKRVDAQADHLARVQLADLALDTFPYNSHSTGLDMLWAGVPMVSLLGNHFSSRVGASMLAAAGLKELITHDPKSYVDLAVALYSDRPRLARLRNSLAVSRNTSPLFDMGRFAAALENLYFQMWNQHCSGRREAILASDSPYGCASTGDRISEDCGENVIS